MLRRIEERGVTSTEETDLIISVAYSRVTKARAINSNAAAINEEQARIRDQFADGNVQQTRKQIDRLATEPDIAVDELSKTTSGCVWLIGQFQLLLEQLDAYCSTEVSQRGYALKLGGHRPDELFVDKDVFDFNQCYFGGISGPGSFTADGAGNALRHDRPSTMSYEELVRRLEPMVSDLPTLEEGQQRMWEYFEKEIARLTERKKLVESREARRLHAALQEAQAPVDRAAVTRARYSADSDRVMFSGIRLLEAIKKERRKHGDDDPEPPTDSGVQTEPVADSAPSDEPRETAQDHDEIQGSDPVGSSLVEAFAEALTQTETGDLRNDAVESQVVDGIGGNEAIPATPDSTPGTDGRLRPRPNPAIYETTPWSPRSFTG